MTYSESGQQAQGQKSGQKFSKAEGERRVFHRQQMQNPEILMPDLDPDKPVQLGELQRFDQLICTRLRKLGYPGTGNGNRPPQPCRPMVLARKLAGNPPSISQADIALLSDRIGWLQRNCFRWSARNGYADYFASRNAKPSPESSGNANAVAVSHIDLSEGQDLSSKAKHSELEPPSASLDGVFDKRETLSEQFVADTSPAAFQSSFLPSPTTPVCATGNASDELESVGGSGGSEWSVWEAEVLRLRPAKVPQMPDRPKTYAIKFPIEKGRDFLYAVAKQKPIAEQIEKARALLQDRSELYQALTHDVQAREDLLNAFASLGLELR